MGTGNKGKLAYILLAVSILPLLVFGIIILLLGTHIFTKAMYTEVETELRNVCRNLNTSFDALYPGDYALVSEDGGYRLYKGSYDLTGDYELIDHIKQNTDLDITLFYQDTRILTTIFNMDGARIIGTGASPVVMSDVFDTGRAKFYTNILVYNTTYFSYYAPLINSDGTVAGMLFVGKPTARVDASVRASIYPLVITDIIFMIVVSFFIFLYTRRFTSGLMQIRGFLKEVSLGNLNAGLSGEVLRRNDELSEIARSAQNMQRSLRNLVEQDALTSLANRRSGDQRLKQIMKNAAADGTSFCVALGDIDNFKRVNDTYGHDCGDLVLKQVADVFRRRMRGNGFAARWGGEEFLLVFENMDLTHAKLLLKDILDDIRSAECKYDDVSIGVTMTFGLTPGNTENMTELLRIVDDRLYRGKNSGKNQVV
ncbi:MAG: diguanylate cyclase [Butyrivibrio sp.]|nr:diguanylate cyclase [Acetatifactor muris]MCM1558191.1 diguanylate cyclase [Butyrivibrio sp.]